MNLKLSIRAAKILKKYDLDPSTAIYRMDYKIQKTGEGIPDKKEIIRVIREEAEIIRELIREVAH